MKFLAILDLDAMLTDDGREHYAAFLRNEIAGVELAKRLGCSVDDAHRGLAGMLTVAKLRTQRDDGRVVGSIRPLRDEGDWQWTLQDLQNDLFPRQEIGL